MKKIALFLVMIFTSAICFVGCGNTNDNKIKEIGNEIQNINKNMTNKIENLKNEQNQMVQTIQRVDKNINKLNEFIKK